MIKVQSNRKIIFLLLVFLALANFFIFGFNNAPPAGDATQYIAYGENLASGQGYSLYGKTFNTLREPGYPFFLFFLFKLFGVGNFLAVKIVQVLLLALTAFFVYLSFELYDKRNAGIITALLVVFIPSYGYYANFMLSEILFTFLLTSSFYLILRLLKKDESPLVYAAAGFIFSLAVLTRAVIIFLPLFIGLYFLIKRKNLKDVIVFYVVFLLLIGGWMGYVYHKTGAFAITEGRTEIHLYTRAVRSTLSYKESLYYLFSYIRRSALGGEENEFLGKYSTRLLGHKYQQLVADGSSISSLKKESLTLILNNPGHYLFGNFIEWIKLIFIEHLYPPVSPFLNRYVRAGFYLLLYGLFFYGFIKFFKNRQQKLRPVFWLSSVFLVYNWLVMSFFDPVPRLNTPYLVFYLLIGLAGIINTHEYGHK